MQKRMCKWEGENKDRSVKNMNDCDHSTIMVDSIDELGASALLAQGVVKRMFIIFSKSLKQEMIPEKIAMDDRDIRLLRWTQNGPFLMKSGIRVSLMHMWMMIALMKSFIAVIC